MQAVIELWGYRESKVPLLQYIKRQIIWKETFTACSSTALLDVWTGPVAEKQPVTLGEAPVPSKGLSSHHSEAHTCFFSLCVEVEEILKLSMPDEVNYISQSKILESQVIVPDSGILAMHSLIEIGPVSLGKGV